MSKKYYAADNQYGSDTSVGFVNTWDVYVFESKADRDKFVANGDLSTRSINRKDVINYATNEKMNGNGTNAPKPFSGEYWGISDMYMHHEIEGCIGQIICCDQFDTAERFYK